MKIRGFETYSDEDRVKINAIQAARRIRLTLLGGGALAVVVLIMCLLTILSDSDSVRFGSLIGLIALCASVAWFRDKQDRNPGAETKTYELTVRDIRYQNGEGRVAVVFSQMPYDKYYMTVTDKNFTVLGLINKGMTVSATMRVRKSPRTRWFHQGMANLERCTTETA